MTNRNDNRERENKYPNKKREFEASKQFSSIQQDDTPEENPKYGTRSHKN